MIGGRHSIDTAGPGVSFDIRVLRRMSREGVEVQCERGRETVKVDAWTNSPTSELEIERVCQQSEVVKRRDTDGCGLC